MDLLGMGRADDSPLPGASYICTLHKYLRVNLPRLAPKRPSSPTLLQQTYTLLTLGLDPSSAPLSRNVKIPLTLGFGTPASPKGPPPKPLLLRLPPDRLLYLLLRWQSLPQALPHVGRTDVPVPEGVSVTAARAVEDKGTEGDVRSVRSWVGGMSVTSTDVPGMGWFRREEVSEDQILIALYSMFTVLPALLIHPPRISDRPIAELIDAGGYTPLGGIDVRVPLDVLRNLQILELEGYDPRGLLIPPNPGLRSLTVRDVQDADEWLEDLLAVSPGPSSADHAPALDWTALSPRFPNLGHLSLHSTTLLTLPALPLGNLTHLDLSHNLLNTLPPSLASLSSLISLNLSNNLITSLRSAPSTLGNIATLNLSNNRIDCLVGLERVLGLQRVDIRGNQLPEVGEVGRLAVLPGIKEIWSAGNPFDKGSAEDWRVELGVAFGLEGKEVVTDDRPWSWNEQRRIDAELAARGHNSHAHSRNPTTPAPHVHPSAPSNGVASIASPSPSLPLRSSAASPASAVGQKKRRPRRVIKLDDEDEGSPAPLGGSLRLPPKTVDNGDESDQALQVPKRGGRRARVSASMFEPSGGASEEL